MSARLSAPGDRTNLKGIPMTRHRLRGWSEATVSAKGGRFLLLTRSASWFFPAWSQFYQNIVVCC
jgi:hypothetical protein